MASEDATAGLFCAQGNGCPFTGWQGYILLTVANNATTHQRLLRPDEWVMSADCFIEIVRRAGWTIIPPADTSGD